jgi:DNA polymerase III subunit delta'
MEFKGIVGHQKAKDLLTKVLARDRLPHALLFSGPPGVGKYTMALELVSRLFCETGSGCGTCRPCQNVGRQSHPDLTILASDSSIGIDLLRGVRKDVYEPPFEAPLRVIIIDGAERMTNEAANALLKTLEEPPPFNLFMLVTSSEKDLPLTIRSRCMRIGFGPLSRTEISAYFLEKLNVPKKKADLLAPLSFGSISSGLFWMEEQNLAIRRRVAELVLGKKKGFLLACALAEKLSSEERALRLHLHFLLSLFTDLWLSHEIDDPKLLVNSDMKELLERATWDRSWIVRSQEEIRETLRSLRYNINRWPAVEQLMLSIMR